MARIKISLPDQFRFQTIIPVRITDLNYGGHVGNDTILSLLHEIRMQFLQSMGFTEMNLEGYGLIMSDVAIEFKSELFYGDKIKALVTAGEFSRVGFELFYKLLNEGNEQPVAFAKTGMICFDYTKRKVTALPEAVKMKLSQA
jgi:acyl-CoA thioesterase FadM